MRILWITNIPFPPLCEKLGIPNHIGGGWMIALANEFKKLDSVKLCVATVYSGPDILRYNIDNQDYYLLPKSKPNLEYDKKLEVTWRQLVDEFKPEVIHIHGTEYAHGLACMNSSPGQNYIISIQGLVSVIGQYYSAGLSFSEILKNVTISDIRRHDTIFQGKKKFRKRGKVEHEYLRKTSFVIGRTCWDYSRIKEINPGVKYFSCNEVLRENFYSAKKWTLAGKLNYSIFVSQAGYPIKGLHQVLKAMALVKDLYPDVRLRVAGIDITASGTRPARWSLSGYGMYISNLINNLGLSGLVTFTGPLDDIKMTQEYLKAHIFICPSSIENSPNSIGEAQIIGTPCIASFVGGIPDMISHEKTGLLYPFEEYSMLASQIIRIFNNNELAQSLSSAEIVEAETRHNRVMIRDKMICIYNKIIEH
jgi:glycosyltransferase involved in cell wall biosynthesis